MKKLLVLVIVLAMTFSLCACGNAGVDDYSAGHSDTTAESQPDIEESSEITADSQPEIEEGSETTADSQPEIEEGSETTADSQSEIEESSETTVDSQPEIEESGETTVDSQPVGVVESSYNPAKLSTFGLPEPSFSYEYLCYEVCIKAGTEHPEFIYVFQSTAEDALTYMKEVSAVWGGWTPDEVPLMAEGDSFWFSTDFENYHINISWDTEGNHFMFVKDYSKNMYWDNETKRDYIEGLEIGTYGIHGTDFTLNGGVKPY